VRADPAELMHRREAAKYRIVSNVHMAGQLGVVREYGVIADLAVVREMHVGHDPVVVADPRHARVLGCAAIKGAKFAYRVVVADFEPRRLAVVFFVLRHLSQRHELVNAVIGADPGMPGYDRVRADAAARSDFKMLAYDRIRTNFDVGGDARRRIHEGGRMNPGCHFLVHIPE
jgi:hypothetical protein